MPPSHVAPGQEVQEPPSSVLLCHVEDQAQMQEILKSISLLGLDIVDIRPLPGPRGFRLRIKRRGLIRQMLFAEAVAPLH